MENQAQIFIIGISHTTAPVEIREQVALNTDEQKELIGVLLQQFEIDGCMVISTCNRTEVYISSEDFNNKTEGIRNRLNTFKNCNHFTNPQYAYFLQGTEAIKHFFKVISGMDSLIIGETQITSQVKECYNLAHKVNGTDTWLNKLINYGLQAEKKVRSETFLNNGAVSISYAGVELARKLFNKLETKSALLIGAGETGELAARHFADKGVKNIHIVNRTLKKAVDLAKKFGGNAHPLEELAEILPKVDIVISATSSDTFVVTKQIMQTVVKQRQNTPLFLIDLAIPRDIDPQISSLNGIFLYNIDNLHQIVQMNIEKRKSEIPKSIKIIDNFVVEFYKWISTNSIAYYIIKIRNHFEKLRQAELKRLKKRLPENGFGEIDYLTQSIVNKIIHQHIVSLKNSVGDPTRYQQHIDFVNNLYQLEEKK